MNSTLHIKIFPTVLVRFLCNMLAILILVAFVREIQPYEPSEPITKCPRQCTCNAEYLTDLPLTKWVTIPTNKYWPQADTPDENEVWTDEDIQLQENPLLHVAFCISQQTDNAINRYDFSPYPEALTLLYGPDIWNTTIKYELSTFNELLALDIKGYQTNSTEYGDVYLHYEALLECQILQYLNIEYVRLMPNPNWENKEIPKSTYEYLQTMLSRQFSNNVLPNIPSISFVIPDEPEILPYNEFKKQTTIISTFSHLSTLQFLRLYRCKLQNLNWQMFEGLKEVKTLSLEGNEIVTIPDFAFFGMPNLKILILSNNKLTNIHSESLAGLFNLEHLDLTNNRLRHLSDTTFAPLPKLHTLDIRHNPIATIYGNTFEVMNATKLLLVGNETNALILQNYAFNGLPELEKLIINGLNVSNLENSLLTGAPNLKYLKLEGNIEFIRFDAFTGSPLLETLILKNCTLRYISMDAFYGLSFLKHLDLSDNQLQSLPSGIFEELVSLEELILTNNQFTTLPAQIFAKLSNIQMIHLTGNPWNCSCEMKNWPLHTVNRIKQIRMVEKCNQYDKTACVEEQEEYYSYSATVVPKCTTPKIYEEWNINYVVHKILKCRKREKYLKKFHSINSTMIEDTLPNTENSAEMTNHKNTLKHIHFQGNEENQTTPLDVDNSLLNDLFNANDKEKKQNEVRDF